MTLVVKIFDTNDHSPTFADTQVTFNVPETNDTGILVGTVMAVDNDLGENAEIRYTITAGDRNGHFNINSVRGA